MDDFELPEGFDEAPAGGVSDMDFASSDNVDTGMDAFGDAEAEEVEPVAPIYVEPQGMDAMPSIENDALNDYNKKWQADIDSKAAKEIALVESTKTAAADELANWRKQRDVTLKARRENNRTEESVVKDSLNVNEEEKAAWGRVLKLVDVATADAADKADTMRMHSLFIQLKNDPIASK